MRSTTVKPLWIAFLYACAVTVANAEAPTPPTLDHSAPLQAAHAVPLEVEGALPGFEQLSRVVLRYRGPGEPYSEVEMHLQYGDLFRAYIPAAQMIVPGVEYHVVGVLKSGARVPLFATEDKPARVFVFAPTAKPPAKARDTARSPPPDAGRPSRR